MMRLHRSTRFGLMLSSVASMTALVAHATTPPAGTVIGNRAAATYVNASGDSISVTSNEVETIVQQVAGLTLSTDSSETVAPGGKVFLPHAIVNNGNGADIFDLTAIEATPGGAFDFTAINIYPDANFDGVADSTTPITATPTLRAGETFGVVIEASVPAGASAATSQDITVTATSRFNNGVSAVNTDTVTVSSDAVTEVVKSMTVVDGSGAAADGLTGPGDKVTITLTYSSTGLADATNLVVTDILDPALIYDAGSARWSDSATGLSDADDNYELSNGAGHQIDYQYDGADTVVFQLDSVPSGRSSRVTFTATIAAGADAGLIENIATQTVNGVDFAPSNKASITVDAVYAVTAADARSATHRADPDNAVNLVANPASTTDDDGVLDDKVTESDDVFQGAAILFNFVVTNQSNVEDTIDVSVANGSFPAGTTFQLLGPDGATPIVGPLGPLASGAAQSVNVIATLPPNAAPAAAGTTNYAATLIARSTKGGAANTAQALFTGAVLSASVDLENDDGTGDGAAPTNGGDPWKDVATSPGNPASYTVTIQNGGPRADTYALALEDPLPTGWTAQFFLTDGTPVTNTGTIPSGGEVDIIVVVTPPADAAPVDQPVTVRVTSPATGQSDTLTNAVVVNSEVDISITPEQIAQIAPGGVADLLHVIKNNGNIAITEGAITLDGNFNNFSGAIFHDVNGDGKVDGGDVAIDNIDDIPGGVAPGGAVPVILRVSAPSTGAVGVSESETIRISTTLNNGALVENAASQANNAVTDTIIIVSNDLTLSKLQALDANCNGTLGGFTAARIQASPGQCIRYRIIADNTGSDEARSVVIRDTTPSYTSLTECGGACAIALTPAGASVNVKPSEGAGGALETSHGDLRPGASAILSFTVKIDP